MRIALSGTHRTGKSTLAAALVHAHPHLVATAEPYYQLVNQGYRFSPSLSLDDFLVQLEYSLEMLNERVDNVVFDRCPLDFLGYLACHRDARSVEWEAWIPRVQDCLQTLDLLVHVPLENPDRIDIPLSPAEEGSRTAVGAAIQGLLGSGMFTELGVGLFTVTGTVEERVRQVLQAVRECA